MNEITELDCTDVPCPLPVIELAKAIGGVPIGAVIAVTARDPAARVDIAAWCRMRDQEYLGEQPAEDDVPCYLVRRRT